MKKQFLAMVALALTLAVGGSALALDNWTGYANDSYGSQISFDSFDNSVKKRMELVRLGGWSSGGLTFSSPVRSDEAYAVTPSSRYSTYESARRRQLDCVYYSGFTVWGDVYQNWSRQKTRDTNDGYRFRTFGPAIGFDWSSNGFTVGIATTYNWGKLKAREISHDRKVHTWGVDAYVQYDTERFYGNLTLGYGYNRFKSDRVDAVDTFVDYKYKYHTNAFNVAGEFGYKFNFGAFKVVPHVGLRYFHDRRGRVNETSSHLLWEDFTVHTGRQNYHTLELPIGVNLGYEFITNGLAFMPQVRLGWTPELARKHGKASGVWGDGVDFSEEAPRRNRHGFNVGLGLEAKITRSLSASIDYDCKFRSGAYEHYWNLGIGFTF